MAIPDEDVAAVRSATDILALIGEYTPLKRVGRRYVGLCPFHAEKTGSFSVNAEEGLYYCFGCQASGDAITFLRNIEGCDFVEAVERLAARSRDRDPPRHRRQGPARPRRAQSAARRHGAGGRLLPRGAAEPAGCRSAARQYLRSRGYEGETVRQFGLGWAPETGRSLVGAVRAPADLLVKAGLAHQGQNGAPGCLPGPGHLPDLRPGRQGDRARRQDPARRRRKGPARSTATRPRHRSTRKGRTLYGLNWAKQAVVQTGEVIICEGYTDVIGFFTAGLPRAVATCGTALTEEHFRLLGRFAKRVVLAFDADAAGQSAAARFYEWETRHELEVAVAALPPGSDPAEICDARAAGC